MMKGKFRDTLRDRCMCELFSYSKGRKKIIQKYEENEKSDVGKKKP